MKLNFKNCFSGLTSAQELSRFVGVGFFLILCAKFYFLFGIADWPMPNAPIGMILLRDVIVCGFLGFFGFYVRDQIWSRKFFWLLWTLGLSISLFQLAHEKSFLTWAQHYLRNVLIPLLFYPVFLGLFKKDVKLPLRKVFSVFLALNLLASYIQLFSSHFTLRPTGLFGDPILNSAILFFCLSCVLSWKKKGRTLLVIVALIPVAQYMSSVSAIASCGLASLTVGLVYWRYWLSRVVRNLKWLAVGVVVIGICFNLVASRMNENSNHGPDGLKAKIGYLIEAARCKDENCWRHWSYQGRIASNLRPFQLCSEDLTSCFLGNVKASAYEKVESNWASLVVNWGAVFALVYNLWMVRSLRQILILRNSWTGREKGVLRDVLIYSFLFFACVYFSLFNTMIYRFPINVILYLSMAYFERESELPQITAESKKLNA